MGKHEAPSSSKLNLKSIIPAAAPKKRERRTPRIEADPSQTAIYSTETLDELIPDREAARPEARRDRTAGRSRSASRGFDFSAVPAFFGALLRKLSRADSPSKTKHTEREYEFSLKNVAMIGVAAFLFILVWLIPTGGWLRIVTFLVPFALAGWETLRDATEELVSGRVLGRSFLISLAAILALCINEYPSAVFIMILFRVLLMVEAFARGQRDRLFDQLADRLPKTARLKTDDGDTEIAVDAVGSSDLLLVKNGAPVPVDGMVTDGMSTLDLEPLLGRNESKSVAPGSSVYSGSLNRGEDVTIRATDPASSSTAELVFQKARQVSADAPQAEGLIRYLARLVPVLFALLGLVFGFIVPIFSGGWREWIGRAALLFAVSATSSFALSLAVKHANGINRAALSGIFFRDADAPDKLSRTATMVFSKAGTVTEGRYKVESVFSDIYSERDLLNIAALAECQSRHPIAQALREAAGIGNFTREDIHLIEEQPGKGITALFSGRNVCVGNAALLMDHGVSFSIPPRSGTVIHVAVDGEYAGHIVLSDRIRDGAFDAIEELRLHGVGETVMLTGDTRSTSRQIASSLNFDLVKSDLDPAGKISSIEYLQASKGDRSVLAYVSDSEEDLPILAHAGLAIGFETLGKRKLLEKSDIAMLDGSLIRLPAAYALSRRMKTKSLQNTVLYGAVKLLLLILGLTGVFSIWIAVFLDVLAGALVLLNAVRK